MSLGLSGVTVRRGRRTILDRLDLCFVGGRLTVVIGPNGAGKSTLLAAAAGLLAHEGDVRWQRRLLPRGRELARLRAYLPQGARVDWPISVERVVALGLTPHLPAFGRLPVHLAVAVDAALEAHDLAHLRERPATELSGGELARAMLARATVADPVLLIADEPTTGLDPRHALDAAGRLRALVDGGRTVVVALHDLDLARRIADDVVALKDGCVLAAGPRETVLSGAVLTQLYDVPVKVTGDVIRFGA